jgi:hypothetical protein
MKWIKGKYSLLKSTSVKTSNQTIKEDRRARERG